jgi:hypothetical protein
VVRALNNQITHVMDERTDVNADQLQDRAYILRWLDIELQRWLKERDASYSSTTITPVDLSNVPAAFAKVPTPQTKGPTNAIKSEATL